MSELGTGRLPGSCEDMIREASTQGLRAEQRLLDSRPPCRAELQPWPPWPCSQLPSPSGCHSLGVTGSPQERSSRATWSCCEGSMSAGCSRGPAASCGSDVCMDLRGPLVQAATRSLRSRASLVTTGEGSGGKVGKIKPGTARGWPWGAQAAEKPCGSPRVCPDWQFLLGQMSHSPVLENPSPLCPVGF